MPDAEKDTGQRKGGSWRNDRQVRNGERGDRRNAGKHDRNDRHRRDPKGEPERERPQQRQADKPVDPDSPFAKLLALKAQLEKRDG